MICLPVSISGEKVLKTDNNEPIYGNFTGGNHYKIKEISQNGSASARDKIGRDEGSSFIWLIMTGVILLVIIGVIILIIVYFSRRSRKRKTEERRKEEYRVELMKKAASNVVVKNLKCFEHGNDGIAACMGCGRGVCKDCMMEIHSKIYCKSCVKSMLEGKGSGDVLTKAKIETLTNDHIGLRYARRGIGWGVAGIFIPGLGIILGTIAIIYGVKGKKHSKGKYGSGGIALGILGIIVFGAWLAFIISNF